MGEFTIRQEDMTANLVGTVTAPPDLADILNKIAEAKTAKQPLTLTPGEVRVLFDHLEGF